MGSRASFYNTGYFQRGGVPLATLPAQVMYPTNSFGFGPRYVAANPHFVSSAYGDPYSGQSYGVSWLALAQVRYRKEELTARNATVNVYDLYDAVQAALKISPGKAAELYPSFSAFTALAATDAAALLKTAYWLAVAGTALSNTVLTGAAAEQAETGFKSGVVKDSVYQTGSIARTYADALALLKRYYTSSMYNGTAAMAVAQLQKGSPAAVKDRVAEAKNTAADAKARRAQADKEQAEKEAKEKAEKEEQDKPPPCETTWKAYIPGYCAAEQAREMAALAAKIAGGVLVAGVAIWGVKRLIKQAKSNPISDSYNPATKKPMPALADKQEQYLARTVLRKRTA